MSHSTPLAACLVAEARGWIGTPYRHAASVKGLGCDCLGLVAGVAAACGFRADAPPYGPDWAEATRRELLLEGLRRHLQELAPEDARAGDVLVFRWRAGRPASHVAFLTAEGMIIHAHARVSVCEVGLTPAWRRRIAAAFRFG